MSKNQPKTEAEIAAMRISGRMLATVLEYLTPRLADSQTTAEVATLARDELKRLGGKPAFLGFNGFPDVICISVNDEVVHGLPGSRRLQLGDIVGLDFGVVYDGMITDGAVTVPLGAVAPDAERLLATTQQALAAGIDAVRAGGRTGDIGAAVEACLRADNLGVIEELIGHGVGHHLHEEPGVPNYGTAGHGALLKAGMTIAIEPMATLGGKAITIDRDGWTFRTADHSLAAQFEHTILVTEQGAEILTQK